MIKNLPTMQETWIRSLGQEDLWRREWKPTPVFLPGKSQGWRSLVGPNSWGLEESDTTERLTHAHFYLPRNCFPQGAGNNAIEDLLILITLELINYL